MAVSDYQRSRIARTMGRLMTTPEKTHIERITNIMAMLLARWVDWSRRSCQA